MYSGYLKLFVKKQLLDVARNDTVRVVRVNQIMKSHAGQLL